MVIPVYNGLEHVRTLFATLSANTTYSDCRFVVIDDCSSDAGVTGLLKEASERDPRITLVRNDTNLGFVRSVNIGLRLSAGRHCVLLNSDTQVPKGWLERLIRPLEEDPRIATVTPFSNAALWFSVPVVNTDNRETMRRFSVDELDDIVARHALPAEFAATPIGHGFCMAMNAVAIDKIGILDEETFGRGYGEEVDWCLRASVAGYRHVVAGNLFVAHYHCGSFDSAEKRRLIADHADIIKTRYPFFTGAVSAHLKDNGVAWRRLGQAMLEELLPRWNADGRPAKRILLVSHEMTITGAPCSLLRMARYFRDAGHIVDVWTLRSGDFVRQYREEGFEVTVVAKANMTATCREAIGRYALIVCNTFATHQIVSQLAWDGPVAWFIREIASAKKAAAVNKTVDSLLRTFPCIYTVSEYARKELSGFSSEISWFNNSVRDVFAGFDEVGEDIRFGYIGAINPNKNIEGLIDAFLAARERCPGITLDICGKDITKTGLIDRLQQKTQGIASIRWLGEVYGEEKDAFFRSIDVLCVPSLSESSCLSLIESAMRGKAIISTENVGANYIIADGGGRIVPAGSVEALRAAIEALAGAPDEVRAMQSAAREGYLRYGTEEKERDGVLKMLDDVPVRVAKARCARIRSLSEDPVGAVRLPTRDGAVTDVKLSVIVPICNMQRYLRECLDSILAQTLRNIEVICVDDGSTDGTAEILREYESCDGRVRTIVQANGGAGKARNTGLAVARGEYVCFPDPDDVVSRDMYERMCRAADDANAEIAVCRIRRFDSTTGVTLGISSFSGGITAALSAGSRSVLSAEMKDELFFMAGYGPCNKVFFRSFVNGRKIRFQEIRRTNDMFFVTTSLANATTIAIVDGALYHYRKGIESVTTNDALAMSFCEACRAVRDRLIADGLYETYETCFVSMTMTSLLNNVQTCYDHETLRALFPGMRESVLALIPSRWTFRSKFLLKAYDLLKKTDDPLAILRLLFDQKVEQKKTSDGAVLGLKAEVTKLNRQLARMEPKTADALLRKRIRNLKREVASLKRSEAYRVGMFVTWPARRAYRMLKRCRKKGFKRMLRRLVLGKSSGSIK